MFNIFGSKEKYNVAFLSYRNTTDRTGRYINYEIAQNLAQYLVDIGRLDNCMTYKPDSIPPGTLYSAYTVVKFLNVTFIRMDSLDSFVVLDKDYFDGYGGFTSIWIQAEYLMWSYYGRGGWFPNKKDSACIVGTPDDENSSIFHISERPFIELDDYTRNILKAASYHNTPNKMGYSKLAYFYIFTCGTCEESSLIAEDTVKKYVQDNRKASCPECGQKIKLSKNGRHFIATPSARTNDIHFILRLLFSKKTNLSTIE